MNLSDRAKALLYGFLGALAALVIVLAILGARAVVEHANHGEEAYQYLVSVLKQPPKAVPPAK